MKKLLTQIRSCEVCREFLLLGPRPIIQASPTARLLIIGQAPGSKVHESGIPWQDASGDRLRKWLGISEDEFYDEGKVALVPMGFCYPGKGKSGDNPPRPECAPLWHDRVLNAMPAIQLKLIIGQYAQARYLPEHAGVSLTDLVKGWRVHFKQGTIPLVHPSPRNQIWLAKNRWFEDELVPELQKLIAALLR